MYREGNKLSKTHTPILCMHIFNRTKAHAAAMKTNNT